MTAGAGVPGVSFGEPGMMVGIGGVAGGVAAGFPGVWAGAVSAVRIKKVEIVKAFMDVCTSSERA